MPTKNTIVVIPAVQTNFYTSISEELFIEKDINWLRLKDVTFRWTMPRGYLGARDASVFVTGTDLFLLTNYSGLDPIVNGLARAYLEVPLAEKAVALLEQSLNGFRAQFGPDHYETLIATRNLASAYHLGGQHDQAEDQDHDDDQDDDYDDQDSDSDSEDV